MTNHECMKSHPKFNTPYNELLEKSGKRLYIDRNDDNKLLLDKLKSQDCISSSSKAKLKLNKFKIERKRV